MRKKNRPRLLIAAPLVLLLVLLSLGSGGAAGRTTTTAGVAEKAAKRPNIVFVLTDDLSWNLLRYMPQVQALRSQGLTFSRFIVTDSLCCPSRTSIFTGRFPHNTGVFGNTPPDGGLPVFNARGLQNLTFARRLAAAGYRTALIGKYINLYEPPQENAPPGWTSWVVGGNAAYKSFDYKLNVNGRVRSFGNRPEDYLTDVLARYSSAFVDSSTRARRPFLLEVSTFAPHAPANAAPRYRNLFGDLRAPRVPSFDRANRNAPAWMANRPPLSRRQIGKVDRSFRRRVRAVQAVDDLIGRLRAQLRARGIDRNTYFVFASDNGYHTGEHRLLPGKMTAFDSDIRVPLVVVGPAVPRGRKTSLIAENVDLYPTFLRLAGVSPHPGYDGHSLVPVLRSQSAKGWRTAALVEHHGPDFAEGDPDRPPPGAGNPTSYKALRLPNAVYVEYAGSQREFYNLRKDPYELNNVYGALSAAERRRLHLRVQRLARCRGARSCWHAAGGRSASG